MKLKQFLLKSPYRFSLFGLIFGIIALWFYWYKTDQIISSSLLVSTSCIIVLNTTLAYFSADRDHYVTQALLTISMTILIMAIYTLFSVSRGIIL